MKTFKKYLKNRTVREKEACITNIDENIGQKLREK